MDDHRFDRLVRSLASGASRRQVLKGMLGIGGGVVAGGAMLETEAARRPTPTPKPVRCPGSQVWNGAACVCPSGTICGPDCCPAEAQCCDNACCYGTCYGEESRRSSPRAWCEATGECCPEGLRCCSEGGCIARDQCCTSDDCPNDGCLIGRCTDEGVCDYAFDCTVADSCCATEACFRSDCNAQTGACGEPIFDCTLMDTCCEDGNICTTESCNPGTGMCDQTAVTSCGCVSDGNGGVVSCGECSANAPCCNGGACGACPACFCRFGPTFVTLADGSTRGSNGAGVCLSPCASNADCPCGQLCVASYQLCLAGTPTADCTSGGRPPGAYCASINLCSAG